MWKKVICLFTMMVLCCSFPSSQVLGTEEHKTDPAYHHLLDKLEELTPGEAIDVRVGTEKERYDIGEPLEIRFQVSKDCYPMLMDISSATKEVNGDITFLLPNHKFPDDKIEAGRVYSTSHDFRLKLQVGPPQGIEVINLFCCAEKIDLFEADFKNEPYYMITPDDGQRLQALVDRLNRLTQSEWSGNSVRIRIGLKGRPLPRKYGALPPIGVTGTTGKWFPPIGATGATGKR